MNGYFPYAATALFAIAVVHTFLVARFRALAHRYPQGSLRENLFHLLGETEAVFLLWAGTLFCAFIAFCGWTEALQYVEHLNFAEPKFVFVIMVIAATRPVVEMVDRLIRAVAQLLPCPPAIGFLVSALTVGPLLGSFVTEPAAMTVTAMVLKRQYFDRGISTTLKYAILGTLFVAISIGGVLTHFAAPPVLMVAHAWHWEGTHMFRHFGWKAMIAVSLSAMLVALRHRRELRSMTILADSDEHGPAAPAMPVPAWVTTMHLAFLGFTVLTSHHPDIFLGGFAFFLGFHTVTKEFQEHLRLREAFLVGGFLAGLVTMGGLQNWWLQPLLGNLPEFSLFLGATGLTAVTDNAALTYLGSQVQGLTEGMKEALVAGAVTGGGLTVIANAPNPAGYSILQPSFQSPDGEGGIHPLGLLRAALLPTLIAALAFWFLPNL